MRRWDRRIGLVWYRPPCGETIAARPTFIFPREDFTPWHRRRPPLTTRARAPISRCSIDGELVRRAPSSSTSSIPPRGRCLRSCPAAGRAELDRAVAAARRAFPAWSARSFEDRTLFIKRMAGILRANAGRARGAADARAGQAASASRRTRSAARPASPKGMTQIPIASETIVDDAERRIELRYVPLGVAGIITPWNAPINLAAGPLASALYTGNTVVLKPSPYTPLSTLKIGELLRDVFPRGVVNVLAGGDALGQWMTEHPGIDKISFTGSVATGKKVMASAAGTLKRVTLELGGNDAAIVLDDVDPKVGRAEAVLRGLREQRPGLHGREAHLCAREDLRRAVRGAGRGSAQVDGGRWARSRDASSGPSRIACSTTRWSSCSKTRSARGARVLAGGEVPKTPGYFVNPTLVTDVDENEPPRARGAVRPHRSGAEVHGRRRRHRAAPTTRATG